MCNLYKVRTPMAEVSKYFGVEVPTVTEFNVPDEILPGSPGFVMREEAGKRILQRWCGASR